jgi:biotin carboxyl carrier protein
MSGTIVKVLVRPGDEVTRFAVLAVMEAMKMEHSIVAPYEGTVTRVDIQPNQTVSAGETLVLLSEG